MSRDDPRGTVLVTGASGALGPTVVDLLRERGFRVRALALSAPAPAGAEGEVDWLVGDICDRKLVEAAMQGVSHVVHMAALLHINNPGPHLAAEYERVNVKGTETVVEAALRQGVERMVFISTIAVYGYDRGTLLTEASEPLPATLYARTKLAGERIVLAVQGADGRACGTVLRLSAVYGGRVKGNYDALVRALARGRFIPIGRGENRRTLVHEGDVAEAIALALRAPAAGGKVYNVTDGSIHTVREITEAICAGLGRQPPRLALPVAPIRLGLRALDAAASLTGRRLPLNSTLLEKYLEDVAVDGSRIKAELGFVPAYELKAGWQSAIAAMRRNGSLPA